MASLTVSQCLGMLQADPDDRESFEALGNALNGNHEGSKEFVRLLEAARMAHEQRGELRAAAWLIELETPLVQDDPDLEAALFKELGRLRHEDLLDDEGARSAYGKALDLRPGDEEIQVAIEQIDQAGTNWKEIAKRFVEEANDASDANLKTSLLTRAASLIWQYKRRGRDKEVDRLFGQALSADPAATRAARLYAETLQARERWQDMGQVLLMAADHARSRDDRLNLYIRAARVHARRLADREAAATCYERVLDFAPGHEEALGFLVEFFTEREDWDHLVALYEDALKSRQRLESEQGILLQLAMVHWRIRDAAAEAEPYFNRLRKLDPSHPGMLDFYRAYCAEAGDEPRLLTILTDAQRIVADPGQKRELAIELARAAQSSDATVERAIDAWKAVQRLDPELEEAHSALKDLYSRAEKWNALVELLKGEIDSLPEQETERRIALLRRMVAIYRDKLQLDVMVINTYNAILQYLPDDAEALAALATTYETMGRWNDLIQILSRQADASEDRAEKVLLYTQVARLWIDRFANYNQATRPLEQVISIEPENREALAQLKDIYTKKRAWKNLYEVLKREAELASDPTARIEHHVELAKLAGERLHRHSDAIELWRQVVDQDPDTEGAIDSLEKLAEREKDWATLADVLERRTERTEGDKGRIKLLQRLGAVYGEHLGDPSRAATAWRRILEIDPRNGRALRTLREAYLDAQDWDGLEALYADASDWEGLVEVLGSAAERAEEDHQKIALSFRAAEVYVDRIGEPHRAFRNYERVLSVEPKNERAARALVPIYERDEKWGRLVVLKETLLDALGADGSASERVAMLLDLARLAHERLSDEQGAYAYAVRAYRVAPDDEEVIAVVEGTARAAGAYDELFELYRERAAVTDSPAEQLRLRRRLAVLAAEHLGKTEDAISELEQVLKHEPEDDEALAVLDRLYRAEGRYPALRALFLHRVEHATDETARWTYLGELAQLEEDVLHEPALAADRFEMMLEIDPTDRDALRSLDRLYVGLERWGRLAEVLFRQQELEDDPQRRTALLLRTGEVFEHHLDEPAKALDAYAAVLDADQKNDAAVAGLERLAAGHPELTDRAGRLLEGAHEARGDHAKVASVLKIRLAQIDDPHERRSLRLRLADLLAVDLKEPGQAYDVLESAFLDEPADAEISDRLADVADQAERHEGLAAAYATAIEAGDLPEADVAELCARTARLYEEVLGRPEAAEPYHRRVLVLDPTADRAFVALKELFTNRERWDDLQGLYRNRIVHTIDAEQKLELLLQVCFLFEEILDDPEPAIRAYQEVLELDPEHHASRRALDRLYRRTERWRDLVALLRQELDRAEGQDTIDLTLELAELYEAKLKEAALAVDQYEAVLIEQPTHLRAQEALERLISEPTQRQRVAAILEPLYEAQGAYAELARILEVQLEDITDPPIRAGLHLRVADLVEHKLHDVDRAFVELAKAVVADPADGGGRRELARLAALRDAQAERAEVLERAIEAIDETYQKSELLMELARLWDESVGDYDAAQAVYRRLIRIDGDNPDVVLPASRALERIHLGKGQYQELSQDLRRQIKFEHDQDVRAALLLRLATLLEETLDDVDGAAAAHRERIDIDPADFDALRALARLYEQQGEWQKLIGILQSQDNATTDESLQRSIVQRIGAVYQEKLGDNDNAVVAYNEVLSRFGNDRQTLSALAGLYEHGQQWQDLLDTIEAMFDIEESANERADLRYRAAELLRNRIPEIERAIDGYGEVLDLCPDHPQAIAALEEVSAAEDVTSAIIAAKVLAPKYEALADYRRLLRVLEVIAGADDAMERLRALRRAAEIAEVGLDDAPRAFTLMGRALAVGVSEDDFREMVTTYDRLARIAESWTTYVDVLAGLIPEILDGDLQTEILLKIADVARGRLGQPDRAREFYARVLHERPDHGGALDALEALTEELADHAGLLEVLRRKAEVAEDPAERIRLLCRQAHLCEDALSDLPGAIDAFEQVLAEQDHLDAYSGLERLYARTERFVEMRSLYERQLDNQVGDVVGVRHRLAKICLEHLGDPDEALSQLREVLTLDRGHDASIALLEGMLDRPDHRALAAEILEPVFLARMDWPKVTAVLEARVEAESDVEERRVMLQRLGQIHEDYLEDLDGAMEVYARLFREDPTQEDAWDTLGRLAKVLEKYERLADIYAAALEEISIDDPVTAKLAFVTGQLYDGKVGDAAKAAPFYRRALAFEPAETGPFLALEGVLSGLRQHRELIALYRERLDVTDTDSERVELLHKSLRITEEIFDEKSAAIDICREIMDLDPTDGPAIEALDRLLTESERFVDLADHIRHRIEISLGGEAEVGLKHRLAQLLDERLDDRDGALDVYEDITEVSPDYQPTIAALEALVQAKEHRLRITQLLEPIYRRADQWKKLIAIFEARLELLEDPIEKVLLLSEIGRLHEERGAHQPLAFLAWARALAAEPENEQTRSNLDRLAATMGNWDEHVAAYEEAVAACDDALVVTQLLTTLARVHDEKRGDPRSAIETYERLLAHDPDDPSPLDALEALQTMVGDWRGLVDVLTRKVERAFEPAERGELLRRAGSVLEELLGDRGQALDYYRRAFEEDDTDIIALEALDRLYLSAGEDENLAAVLTRRSELETDSSLRIEIGLRLGALLETALARPDQAIDAYQRVLDDQAGHADATAALSRLYERQGLWPELLDNLRLRASLSDDAAVKVALVHRAGEVLEREMDDLTDAVATYQEALALVPTFEPAIAALLRIAQLEEQLFAVAEILEPLLESQERWDDLAGVLERKVVAATDPFEKCVELRRVAAIHEHGRQDLEAAFDALGRALGEDPADADTTTELERIALEIGAWERLANILAARASSVLDPTAARSLYARLSRIAEHRLEDDPRAIEALSRAVEQAGEDDQLLAELDRLYGKTGDHVALTEILDRRAALASDPRMRNELLVRLGIVRAERIGDPRGAYSAYQEVLDHDPAEPRALAALEGLARDPDLSLEVIEVLDNAYRNTGALDKVALLYDVRVDVAETDGERVRLLQEAARLWEEDLGDARRSLDALRRAFLLDPRDEILLNDLERLASAADAWESLRGLVSSIGEREDLDRMIVRDLNLRAASWYRDRLQDPVAAEERLREAIEADPDAGDAHGQLSELLRGPGREADLVATLRAWAEVEMDGGLRRERLVEAARLAEDSVGDVTIAGECLERALNFEPNDIEVLDELTRLRRSASRWPQVAELLSRRVEVESSPAMRSRLRHELGAVLAGPLEAFDRAIETYQQLLDEEPQDREASVALEALFEKEEMWDELEALVQRRLDVATDVEEQIAARVRLARLMEQRFGKRDEAIAQLMGILELDPAHREALDELERLYEAGEYWRDLVALLETRAGAAHNQGAIQDEVTILVRLASVQEENLGDSAEAVRAYERVVGCVPEHGASLHALVRLHEQAGAFQEMAHALERLLSLQSEVDAVQTAHRLAEIADTKLEDPAMAERALRRAFELEPASATTRELLKAHFEAHQRYESLAELLVYELESVEDQDERVSVLRRIAELYRDRLQDPGGAARYLEGAAELVPEDRSILLPLCDLYIAAGRSRDAVPVLERIIASYGTRRVKEVAEYHHRLGRAQEEMGDPTSALASYDAAFKIDLTNVQILRDLGRLCHRHGDFERAQKTFRALLLQKLDPSAGISKADVYFYLGDICAQQGDPKKAISMLERAVAEEPEHPRATALLAGLKG